MTSVCPLTEAIVHLRFPRPLTTIIMKYFEPFETRFSSDIVQSGCFELIYSWDVRGLENTCILASAMYGFLEMVKYFQTFCSQSKIDDAMRAACEGRHLDIVWYLLDFVTSSPGTMKPVLELGISLADLTLVEHAIHRGAIVEGEHVNLAMKNGNYGLANLFLTRLIDFSTLKQVDQWVERDVSSRSFKKLKTC